MVVKQQSNLNKNDYFWHNMTTTALSSHLKSVLWYMLLLGSFTFLKLCPWCLCSFLARWGAEFVRSNMWQALFSCACFVNLLRWRVRWAERFLMTAQCLEWLVWVAEMIPSLPVSLTNNILWFRQTGFSIAPTIVFFRRQLDGEGVSATELWKWTCLRKLCESYRAQVRWHGHMSGMRSAEVTRQSHERELCFMMGGRSICFVFQPNKERQVGLSSLCSTSVFLVWEEVSKNQEAVLRCGTSHLRSLRYGWSVAYMVTHAPWAYFRSSTDTTCLFVSCRKVLPSCTL